ncbi:SGNH/GDSL hydrolase family protein [Streptomyces polygonati]|uniref:SGNH/GDSL hydrolase family protein n=1 Tax=Streptomyces polygonati TaxID=1617087 RepID=A0ABV8HLU5_9ACTN
MTHDRPVRGAGVTAALITIAVAVAVALLSAGGKPAGTGDSAVPRSTVRVMPLGDSITWGQGSPSLSGYRKPLWDLVTARPSRYAVRFVGSLSNGDLPQPANEGHRGWTIGEIDGRIDQWLAASRPDVVLLHIGINDLRRDVDVAHAPARLAALVDRIYADRPGVSVVYMGLLPNTAHLRTEVMAFDRRAAALQPAERRRGRAFWYVAPPALTAADMSDSVHPDDAGYRRIAAAFFPALNAAVAGRTGRPAPAAGRPPAPALPPGGATAAGWPRRGQRTCWPLPRAITPPADTV